MARQLTIEVTQEYNERMLKVLLRRKYAMSARFINSVKHTENGFLINGVPSRTVDIIRTGDIVTVNFPEEKTEVTATSFANLNIIYEDEDILILNKPARLAVHPTHNHQGDTLANEVTAYFGSKDESIVFRAVGRLDKCTSGVMVCALNRPAASKLSEKTGKTYLAVVEGEYTGSGTIDTPIYRPDPMKTLRAAGAEGDRAITHWKSLANGAGMALLEITLETGRTHQIRVHFSSLGTPLVGDEMYGSTIKEPSRACLHCFSVSLVHPVSGEKMYFEAPLPDDMQMLADKITAAEKTAQIFDN